MAIHDIITEHHDTGVCRIDVERTIKLWKERWSISEYLNIDTDAPEFTLFVLRKGKKYQKLLKCRIADEQANELIEKLSLVRIPSTVFRRAACYHTLAEIHSELEELSKGIEKRYEEINRITNEMLNLKRAINHYNNKQRMKEAIPNDTKTESALA